jgi:hypothetical protein
MDKNQLKHIIKEEYQNVKSFMEDKYGFTPELGKVISNPYAKSFVNEVSEPEVISQLRDIVNKKQNKKIKDPKSGKMMRVDMFSASAVTKVYDAINKSNKEKFSKLSLPKMVNVAFTVMKKESVNELLVIVDKFDKNKQDYGKIYYRDGGNRPGDGDINKANKELAKLSKKHKGLTLVSVGRNSKMYDVNESLNEAKYKHTYKSITDQQKDLKRIFPSGHPRVSVKAYHDMNPQGKMKTSYVEIEGPSSYVDAYKKMAFNGKKTMRDVIKFVEKNESVNEEFKSKDSTFEKVYGIFDKRDYFNNKGFAKTQIGNFERALQKKDKGAQQILDKFKGDVNKAKDYIFQVLIDRRKEESFNDYKAFKAAVDSIQKGKPIPGAVDLVKRRIHNNSQKYTMALYSALRNQKFNKWKDIHTDVDSLIGESVNEAYIVLYAPKKGVKPVTTAAYKDKKDAEKWAKDLGGVTMIIKRKVKGIDEGKKRYYQKDGIGKAKYTISYHDGKKTHKDGSDFFDIQIFKNKKDLAKFVNTLHKAGYVYGFNEGVNEGVFSNLDLIRQNSKDARDFIKNVFKDDDFKDMKNDREFLKYLKSIYEGFASDAQRRAAFASGYKAKGKKGKKKESIEEYDVENYQDVKEFIEFMREYEKDPYALNPTVNEAEYQGRDVKLGKIMQGDVKKFKVYVKNPKGNVVKVNFGHKGKGGEKTMRIKKSDPARRKAFRSRHNCDNPGPRHKARYWACRTW